MRKLTAKDVTFKVTVEQDEMPFRGNAMASGDDKADRALEHEIADALDRGQVEAWCIIVVKAIWSPDGEGMTLEGVDTLGGCCFLEPIEVNGETWSIDRQVEEHVSSHGMREEALRALNAELASQRKAARKLLRATGGR